MTALSDEPTWLVLSTYPENGFVLNLEQDHANAYQTGMIGRIIAPAEGSTVAAGIISAEEVRSEVNRYWVLFTGKSADALAEFYSHQATVFSPMAERWEPGRVAVIRRTREYFHTAARIDAQLGPVEVQLLGAEVAVASYTFSFTALHVANEFHGETTVALRHCRATQVFVRDPDGALRIHHEHISIPAGPE